MPALKDYYRILEVGETASEAEIKKAYRTLARKYHPDHNAGDRSSEERFKEVQEAYDVLSDTAARRKYDRARKHPFASAFGNEFTTGAGGKFYRSPDGTYVRMDDAGPADDGLFGGVGDLFERFFGGDGAAQQRTVEPETLVRLTFDAALKGGKAEVRLPDGRTVRVPYPKGVADGHRVRLRSSTAGRGAYYVRFRVTSHPDFRRDDDDLHTTVDVNPFEAILGGSRPLTTPYGKKLKITIPKGSQPGEKLRLRGQGIQTEKSKGDLFVEIRIVIPTDLTRFEEEELRKAAEKAGLL